MALSLHMQQVRNMIERVGPDCDRHGSMEAIHRIARHARDIGDVTPREAFALGELYQICSTESALYVLDELAAEE